MTWLQSTGQSKRDKRFLRGC